MRRTLQREKKINTRWLKNFTRAAPRLCQMITICQPDNLVQSTYFITWAIFTHALAQRVCVFQVTGFPSSPGVCWHTLRVVKWVIEPGSLCRVG